MDIGLNVLSDITVFSKYAKYIPEVQRRETWDEITDRYELMMMKKFPQLKEEIIKNGKYIKEKKNLPSMRALQFAGTAIEVNNARAYNCAYLPIDSVYSFSETMFLLLGGTGVGYSVQKHHIEQLPVINKADKKRKYLIQDSIIGWADSVKALLKGYFGGKTTPDFDFRDIRPKGTRLVTAGGKAPGPEPLKECLFQIQKILDRKDNGEKLSSLECHDILCHIANSVLAGGIRRSAMIALFSKDDREMMECKFGNWWELNEQRGRSNNSVVLERHNTKREEFDIIWKKIEKSGSGEPGIYWTNNKDWGTNPCCEIALRPYQFCNLCEINTSNIEDQEDLENRVRVATFFGTLQASFTDFHYLRPIWKSTTEKEALLGLGQTGIASNAYLKCDLAKAAEVAINENERMSELIGINPAARLTTVKPAGTTSCVLGCSSGIHAWHNDYYLRTLRFNENEEIAIYLLKHHPELCESDILRSDTVCIRIPIKAPKGAVLRIESALDTLERIKYYSQNWVKKGHISGDNTHNVSATISLKDNEWKDVGDWMWKNRRCYNGLSILPYYGGTYSQPPFEDISQYEYNKRIKQIQNIDLRNVIEIDDSVNFGAIAACAGGSCEIS